MFAGTNIAGIDNPANWVADEDDIDPSNPNISGTTYATQDAAIFCFACGTQISTPTGETAVEALKIGDLIRTADGRDIPVKWVGRQTLNTATMGPRSEPVRIEAGALEGGVPSRDLTVTGDHGMVIDDYVINASALVNGTSIKWVSRREIPTSSTYYHIKTADHDVIMANGTPSETFVDAVSRTHFDNFQEYLDLYGAERIIFEMDCPRISTSRLVPNAIKMRLGIDDKLSAFDQLAVG